MAQENNLMIDYKNTFYSPLNIPSEYETEKEYNSALPTWLTFTTEKTVETGKEMLKYSPIVTGIVSSKGPRHCPSLDRKIMNFPERLE